MKTRKIHYAWIILLSCILIQIGSLGGIGYSNGIYYASICNELGVGRGDVALYQTITSLVSAFMSPFVGKWLPGKNMGKKMALAMVGVAFSYGMMSQYTALWQFYLSGILMGVCSSFIFLIPVPILISNWFYKGAGTALGLAMCSGLGGSIMTQIGARTITLYGWRPTYIIIASLCALLVIPTALFLVKFRPEDVGMKPWGADETYEAGLLQKSDLKGVPYSVAIKSKPFIIFFLTAGFISASAVYHSHLPSYAGTLGWDPLAGANLASTMMICSMAAKLIIGQLIDRLGPKTAAFGVLTVMTLGFLGTAMLNHSVGLLYASVILTSFGPGTMSLGIPMIARTIFGTKDHSRIFGFITMGSSLLSAANTSTIGYIYDFTGSYVPAFIMGAGICVVAMTGIFTASGIGKKVFAPYFADKPEERQTAV